MSEVTCQNCSAACCKGPVTVELTAYEKEHLLGVGTDLYPIVEPVNFDRPYVAYPAGVELDDEGQLEKFLYVDGQRRSEPLDAGLGRYMLIGTCGFLKTDPAGWEYCSGYDDRPKICQDFEIGSLKCRLIRVVREVDVPSDAFPGLQAMLDKLQP